MTFFNYFFDDRDVQDNTYSKKSFVLNEKKFSETKSFFDFY